MARSSQVNSHQAIEIDKLAAFVGIDWGDREHAGCLCAVGSDKLEEFTLKHKPAELDNWAIALRKRFQGRTVVVCLEQSKGPLIFALLKYEFLALCPINPVQLANYRKAVCPSNAKDDPTDAALILDFVRKHPENVRVWRPDDADARLSGMMGEGRRDLVDERSGLANTLRSHLKHYFPQAIEILGGELTTNVACEFLKKWPTLEKLCRAKTHSIRKFFYAHNCRSEKRMTERFELIDAAKPLTTDPAVNEYYREMTLAAVAQLKALQAPIRNLETRQAELMSQQSDAVIFNSLPGAGKVLAPRLLAAFGTDRNRYQSAAEMQTYSGAAPVTKRSGKTTIVHWRWACPKFLRQTFHEFALHSRGSSAWAKAFYEMKRADGYNRHAALRMLAYKWIRIIFRCWQDRTLYDEAKYLEALRRSDAPLLKYLAKNACTAQ